VGTSNRRLGIDIVVRNFEGHLIVVNCLIKMANLKLIAADALVAYQIVGFSKELGFHHIILEEDTLQVMKALQVTDNNLSRFG
jgi:hypothetical protein